MQGLFISPLSSTLWEGWKISHTIVIPNPLYIPLSIVFRVTSWIGMPKKLFGTVSFQTKFLGWDFFSMFFFFFSIFSLITFTQLFFFFWVTFRWIQLRLVYWSPSLTSTYRIYKKSMISWSSKSTNLVLIIDVLVSDHQASKKKKRAFFYNWWGI